MLALGAAPGVPYEIVAMTELGGCEGLARSPCPVRMPPGWGMRVCQRSNDVSASSRSAAAAIRAAAACTSSNCTSSTGECM